MVVTLGLIIYNNFNIKVLLSVTVKTITKMTITSANQTYYFYFTLQTDGK